MRKHRRMTWWKNTQRRAFCGLCALGMLAPSVGVFAKIEDSPVEDSMGALVLQKATAEVPVRKGVVFFTSMGGYADQPILIIQFHDLTDQQQYESRIMMDAGDSLEVKLARYDSHLPLVVDLIGKPTLQKASEDMPDRTVASCFLYAEGYIDPRYLVIRWYDPNGKMLYDGRWEMDANHIYGSKFVEELSAPGKPNFRLTLPFVGEGVYTLKVSYLYDTRDFTISVDNGSKRSTALQFQK